MQSIIKNETILDPQRLKPGTMRSPVQNDAVSLHHHIGQDYHKLRQHWWQPKWILTTELKAHFTTTPLDLAVWKEILETGWSSTV